MILRPLLHLALCLAAVAPAAWTSPQEPVARQTVLMPMRDGVRLAADVYGASSAPKPVLLARTPYNKDGLRTRAESYARGGYVVVIQDCRGRYASEGAYVPYNDDRQDSYDTLEWIHRQPWSNGKAGMFGGSHLGLVQWLAAAEESPGLAVITPAVTASSLHRVSYRGTALRLALISSGGTRASPPPEPKKLPADINHLLHHLPLMHLPLADLEKAYGWSLPWMTGILRHPDPGGFWNQTSAEEMIPRMRQPVQLVTGYYDFFHHDTMQDFERLRRRPGKLPVQIVMGPWTHGGGLKTKVEDVEFGPEAKFDVSEANLEWFDHHLRGVKKDFPLVRYFSMGDNRWYSAGQWPPKEAAELRLELGKHQFLSDPANPVPSVPEGRKDVGRQSLWSPIDLSAIGRHPHVVTMEMPPLSSALRIAGPVRAELRAKSDPPDADWVVRLFAVRPGGFPLPLAHGITRGRFAAEGTVTVDMGSVAAMLEPGTRLRIEVAGSSFPMYDRNLHTPGGPFSAQSAVARQTVSSGAVILMQLPARN